MATQTNAMQPSLVSELREMNRRLSALERKPEVLAKFDRYPTAEWAAIPREQTAGNIWSSVGIANVTGLVYDRVQLRYIFSNMVPGVNEAEMRLAAFKHTDDGTKTCVSASRTLLIHGDAEPAVGTITWQWIHGIPHGWDYDEGPATYTIEAQHRYLVGPWEYPAGTETFGIYRLTEFPGDAAVMAVRNADNTAWHWVPSFVDGTPNVYMGWLPHGDTQRDQYHISTLHYCVGLPEDRAPLASTDGRVRAINGGTEWGTAGNINDPTL